MKKLFLLILCLCLLLIVIMYLIKKEQTANKLSDYKPMVYVQDILYGDSGKTADVLPDGYLSIGTIQSKVLQSTPIVKENFTSNNIPVGSEVYGNETNLNIIYIKILSVYSIYEAIP